MDRTEYYTIDHDAMSMREIVRSYGLGLRLPIVLLLKLLRNLSPSQPNTAFRMPQTLEDIEVSVSEIPSPILIALRSEATKLKQSGFTEFIFTSSYDELPKTSTYAVSLRHRDEAAWASVCAFVADPSPGAKIHIELSIYGISHDDQIYAVRNRRAGFDPIPGTTILVQDGSSPSELWQFHQAKFASHTLRKLAPDALRQRLLARLQHHIRHYLTRGIYRPVTTEELAALGNKIKDLETPPPLPVELAKNREQRHIRAREIRPPSPCQRWNALAQFFAVGGFFLIMLEIYANPETASEPGDSFFVLILLYMNGFAWCCMLLSFLFDLLRACTICRATCSDLKKKLRQAPLKIRTRKSPTVFRTGLLFFPGPLLWGLVVYSRSLY